MNRPRVVLVALHFAEYSAKLALALSKQWDVLLVLYRSNAENELGECWQDRLCDPNLKTVALDKPRLPPSVIRNTFRLLRLIREFRPDVIHFQEDPRDEIILALPMLGSIPKVLTVHDPIPHEGLDSRRLRFSRFRLYRPWIRRSADIAITHGGFLVRELEQACPWLKYRIARIAHGPLNGNCAEESPTRPEGLRLLFFGRIHEYKGLRFFVDALIRLRHEGMPVIGVVAGRGSDLERHRATMEAAGCFEILDRYIAAPEVPRLFRAARAVVLPYIDGTQSGVAAMALGFGTPVVASAVGSIPELVRHGVNGLLVPPKDASALAEAVRSICLDDRLRDELADGACGLRDGKLSWATIAEETSRTYRRMLNEIARET